MTVSLIANGKPVSVEVAPTDLLTDVLRDKLHLHSVKRGCETGDCGACTVLVDGVPVNSCIYLAARAEGREITTLEGLGDIWQMHPIQRHFRDAGAVQCGFCAPGMILTVKALLDRNPTPTDEEIRGAIYGNLCRCSGYVKIVQAVHGAAAELRGKTMALDGFEAIGKRIPRTDAATQVTGTCVYGEDLYRPGMLYAKAHYSKHPHARLRAIDTAAAEAMPGVAAVITHRDVPHNRFGFAIHDQPVLADDKVRYRGDCIAVVAADTPEQAAAAAAAVHVEYEPLPMVFHMQDALAEGAPLLHEDLFDSNVPHHIKAYLGDVEQGFAESDVIVEHTYRTQKMDHAPIEPHVALAELEPDGSVTVTTSTSRPFHYIGVLTQVLQLPMSRVRCKTPPGIGGAFGGKNEVVLEPWVALLAMKTRRPVKMVFTREEDLSTSTIRHAYTMHYKTGVKRDGTLVAQQVELYADTGAYLGLGKSQLTKAVMHACGPYTVPNVKTDGYLVFTNTLIASAMRGMGVPQVCFACESHMDRIAEALDMDRIALRSKNLFGDRGGLPNGQLINSRAARATLDRALEILG